MTKSKDPSQLTRSTRRARITRTGAVFAFLSAAVAVAAFNTGVNLLYLLMSMLLSALAIAYVMPALSIGRVSIQRNIPSQMFAGARFQIELSVHNAKRLLPSLFVMLEDHFARVGRGEDSAGGPGGNAGGRRGGRRLRPPLAIIFRRQPSDVSEREGQAARRLMVERAKAGETVHRGYAIHFPRRGLYRFHGLRASTKFPFGLFCCSNELDGGNGADGTIEEAVVYPAYGKLIVGEAEVSKVELSYMGRLLSKGYGEEEFYGLREYRPGDNPRRIHWKSSARSSKPLVKELDSSIAGDVSIFLDTHVGARMSAERRRQQLEMLEIAVSFAATLAKDLIQRGYSVSFTAFTPELTNVPSGKGTRHLFRILRELAILEPSEDKDIISLFFGVQSGEEGGPSLAARGRQEEVNAALRNAAPIVILLGGNQSRRLASSSALLGGRKSSRGYPPSTPTAAREVRSTRGDDVSNLSVSDMIARLDPSARVYDVSDPGFQSVFEHETLQVT